MNPLERLAGGDLPPSLDETRRRILEQLAADRLARIAIRSTNEPATFQQPEA